MFLITLASTSISMYSMLITMDIDMDIDDDDHIPFEWAVQAMCSNNNPKVLTIFISKDPSLTTRHNEFNSTLLHYAAAQCSKKTISALIRAGADVNAQDMRKLTPLHLAASRGDPRIVRILLAAGADISMTDDEWRIPLDIAVDKGRDQVTETLMDFLIGIDEFNKAIHEHRDPTAALDALPEWFWREHSALVTGTKTSTP